MPPSRGRETKNIRWFNSRFTWCSHIYQSWFSICIFGNLNKMTNQWPFLEGPKTFSSPESRSKISNLVITRCFNQSILLHVTKGSLHRKRFGRIQLSVFRSRLIQNGFPGPKRLRRFRKKGPQVSHQPSPPRMWDKLGSFASWSFPTRWNTSETFTAGT